MKTPKASDHPAAVWVTPAVRSVGTANLTPMLADSPLDLMAARHMYQRASESLAFWRAEVAAIAENPDSFEGGDELLAAARSALDDARHVRAEMGVFLVEAERVARAEATAETTSAAAPGGACSS